MSRKLVVALAILLWIGPAAAPVRAQSDQPPPHLTVHIVQRGETLFSIARRYGLTVDAITHANGIPDPRQIYVGQRLAIPGIVEGDTSALATVGYVVQAGDTLAAIARRYHITWQILVQLNGLLSPDVIHAGQVIQVPAPSMPAGEGEASRPPMG
ncbi:MAG: LysM domain-containing protein, partial [Anaerolineae bacterium]